MVMHVPLIGDTSLLEIRQLDHKGTWGGPTSLGFDPILREPYPAGARNADTRRYLPAIRIPVQVEVKTYEQLHEVFAGDTAATTMVFVVDRMDLMDLGLIDLATGRPKIDKGDKIMGIYDKEGAPLRVFADRLPPDPLYIFEVRPGSWSFGGGYGLELLYTTDRCADPIGGQATAK
jgi:hypothetical protein